MIALSLSLAVSMYLRQVDGGDDDDGDCCGCDGVQFTLLFDRLKSNSIDRLDSILSCSI